MADVGLPIKRDHCLIPLGQQMRVQRKPPKRAAHIQTALEASCGALIVLESIRPRAEDHATEELCRPIQQAIDSLRQAIVELRSASDHGPSRLPKEFVLRAGAAGVRVPAR